MRSILTLTAMAPLVIALVVNHGPVSHHSAQLNTSDVTLHLVNTSDEAAPQSTYSDESPTDGLLHANSTLLPRQNDALKICPGRGTLAQNLHCGGIKWVYNTACTHLLIELNAGKNDQLPLQPMRYCYRKRFWIPEMEAECCIRWGPKPIRGLKKGDLFLASQAMMDACGENYKPDKIRHLDLYGTCSTICYAIQHEPCVGTGPGSKYDG